MRTPCWAGIFTLLAGLLSGCSVDELFNTEPSIVEESDLRSPYVVGAEIPILARGMDQEQPWRLESSDEQVVSVPFPDSGPEFVCDAVGGGTAELRLLDPDGKVLARRTIEVRAPDKAPVGQESKAEVIVTPRNGYKINVEYPAKLLLKGIPAGTKVAERITKRQMSVSDKRLTVPVAFTPEGPGEKSFSGELRFSVCDKQSCQMPRETISWKTVAEGAAPAPPPPGDGGPTSDGGAAEAGETAEP